MNSEDIHDVLTIQAACYTEIVPESGTSLLAKLHASPSSCFVAEHIVGNQQRIAGYLFSIPWRFSTPPPLDAPDCILPAQPDCLYLHDLAVAPSARNTGAGQALVAAFMDKLHALPLRQASLIAIQGSAPYWQSYGFNVVETKHLGLQDKLASYGTNVAYMHYPVRGAELEHA